MSVHGYNKIMKDRPSVRLVHLLLASFTLMIWSVSSLALPDDRKKPIHITADKAVRDEKKGVTTYTGNVKMRQGSIELDADNLIIYHESQDADKIVASGAPAKMRQRPEIDQGLVHAHAKVITYYRNRELVHLRTEARIEKEDGTLVTGDEIDYFIDRELMKAKSNGSGETKQIFVVIPPSTDENEEASSDIPQTPPPPDPNTPQAAAVKNSDSPSSSETVTEGTNTDKETPPGGETSSQ
jgi:lipopolysaccharide export system protein LptA